MSSRRIYDAPGVVEALFDAEKQLVFVRWHAFPGDGHFRPCLEAQVALVRDRQVRFIVVDVSTATGAPHGADQEYLVQEVFPVYRDCGVEAVVTIVPASAITRMGANRWQRSGAQFGFGMYEAQSLTDAQSLVKSLRAQAA